MSIVQQAFVSPKSIRFVLYGAVVCLFLTNLSLEHNFWSKRIAHVMYKIKPTQNICVENILTSLFKI